MLSRLALKTTRAQLNLLLWGKTRGHLLKPKRSAALRWFAFLKTERSSKTEGFDVFQGRCQLLHPNFTHGRMSPLNSFITPVGLNLSLHIICLLSLQGSWLRAKRYSLTGEDVLTGPVVWKCWSWSIIGKRSAYSKVLPLSNLGYKISFFFFQNTQWFKSNLVCQTTTDFTVFKIN